MPCGSSKDSCHQDKNGENGHCAFEDLDHSVLQQPLNLGVTNIKQILKCIQSGSREIKDIILNECNIIYECKACVGLFRSLANFMYHKRCYCKKHLCEDMVLFENFEEEETVIVQPEAPAESIIVNEENIQETPKMTDCTVDLVKTEIAQESFTDSSKEIPASDAVHDVSMSDVSTDISVPEAANNVSISDTSKEILAQDASANQEVSNVSNEVTVSDIQKDVSMPDIHDDDSDVVILDNPGENPQSLTTVSEASNNVKNKNAANANKTKGKLAVEPEKVASPMISRRTRDKNAQNPTASTASKITLKAIAPEEPPLKCAKIISAKIIRKEPDVKPSTASNKKDSQSDVSSKDVKSKKIEISKFTGALEKSIPSFPKIIFKAIDSNPHAVYQSNDKKKLDSFGLNTKYENSTATVETKVDNDKLIIVLKKDVKTDNASVSKPSESNRNETDKMSDFHLTRRKRLMFRNDCNVHELKCLTCKTQFMSLKTLYFHMLSLHSKKRLYYPCPFCKTFFVQMYGVTRHLISIHNKTKEQINKLRDVIKKKSVWKRIDDVNPTTDTSVSSVNYQIKVDPEPEVKMDSSQNIENENNETDSLKTVIKFGKNVTLHQCSKCNRVFGRKSSQVSHQKFCIMNNPVKTEGSDSTQPVQPTSPPVVSFLSLSPKSPLTSKPASALSIKPENSQIGKYAIDRPALSDVKISIRPKRGAEKQMHKDFVNSQTLKWRSANRVDTNANNKSLTPVKKSNGKNLEKKVLSFMNAETLMCLKCDKKFSSYSNLRRHVAIHVGWTRFKCRYCDYQAYNKSQCWSHVQKAHSVDENDMDKSIVNLVNGNVSMSNKKSLLSHNSSCSSKKAIEMSKPTSSKTLPKVKITKKKISSSKTISSDKKQPQVQKKELPEIKEVEKEPERETETKKEKGQLSVPVQKIPKKETNEPKKEKPQATISIQKFPKKDVIDKKEKPQHIVPIQKITIPDYKRETNYKSVTTSNPTTIILSKKIPSSTVQSIVTISPESVSSTSKISPIRTSPRKTEIKSPGEKLITTLVTRSSAYSKNTPIQIKLPVRSNSVEEIPKESPDKNCSKKEKLISEWFPKKDLSSTNVRRESAPLIIGLVPAANAGLTARAKNSAIAFEKSSP